MFRPCLLAAMFVTGPAMAQPSMTPDLDVCENIPFSQDNCVRVVGCLGDQGLQFDGKARGWDQGTIGVEISDFTLCEGTWINDGPGGTGYGELTCDNGITMEAIYYNLDPVTGTVIGRGKDSLGRLIQVWSGENVLQFLTPDGQSTARLPCVSGDIPIN